MNDEPRIRLRPRKSNHGLNENPRKEKNVGSLMFRLVEMSKRGQNKRSMSGERGSEGSTRVPRTFNQRVAVRVSYSTNKNPGQWRSHGRYVARESATQGGRAVDTGFNATNQTLDIATKLDNWQTAGDERLFKIIVSPEFADRLNLQQYARELMRRMEHDLGTKLEWVAAFHRNTEHPHVHIAVRGVDDQGRPLLLAREYIRGGLRGRAEEIATEALGDRSRADAHEGHGRKKVQSRYTSLDRMLQPGNDGSSSHFAVTAEPNDDALRASTRILQQHLCAQLIHL